MSDTPVTSDTPTAPAPEAPAQQETFSADYVKTLRDEAAAARIAKKEAVDAAKAEVIKEYEGKAAEKDTALAELQTQHTATSLELLKLRAILAEEIPADKVLEVAELVQGTDEESVSASVKRVKSLMGDGVKAPSNDRPVDPSQGSGSTVPLNGDPIVNLLKNAIGAR